jgi:hypothetical protein
MLSFDFQWAGLVPPDDLLWMALFVGTYLGLILAKTIHWSKR